MNITNRVVFLILFTLLIGPLPAQDSGNNQLSKMKEQIVHQMEQYHQNLGTKPWDYRTASRDLSCQIGSLMKLMMQLENERYRHGKSDSQIKAEIGDELADILSLVLFISHDLKIDIASAWDQMIKSDQKKFKDRKP
jgi:hypothetical protein